MIILEVSGNPIPWMRPGRKLINGQVIVYDKQSKLKEQVKWQLRSKFNQEPLPVPVAVTFTYFMPIPKYVSKKMRQQMEMNFVHHMKRPDVDNISKFYLDCLTGVVLRDDCQVWRMVAEKRYSSNPKVVIELDPVQVNVEPEPSDGNEEDEEWW